jgi:hypothetical protein
MASQFVKRLQRHPELIREMLRGAWLWAVVGLLSIVSTAEAIDNPQINVWYGTPQAFGTLGRPQPWCNILGSVSSDAGILSLAYSLNAGPPIELSLGPDGRRLAQPGDFNIDLPCQDLNDGSSQVVIVAQDMNAQMSTATVEVNYTSGTVWPLPYTIQWDTVEKIADAADIVDGQWVLEGDQVRTLEPGYDRLLAIGDASWRDYEVVVPVIVHQILPGSNGVGVVVHWNGHTEDPLPGWQPKAGWIPVGAIGWYRGEALRIEDGVGDLATDAQFNLELEVPYLIKMQVQTPPQQLTFYRLKMWKTEEEEPSEWHLSAPAPLSHPTSGSVLLIAHRVDASFGPVTITPLGLGPQP